MTTTLSPWKSNCAANGITWQGPDVYSGCSSVNYGLSIVGYPVFGRRVRSDARGYCCINCIPDTYCDGTGCHFAGCHCPPF